MPNSTDSSAQLSKAREQIAIEAKNAKRWEQQRQAEAHENDALRHSLRETMDAQRQAAQASNRQAVGRIRALAEEVQEVENALVANKVEEEAGHVEAVLGLKQSIERTTTAIKSQNEKRNRKQQALEASLRASYDDMLTKGLNPYEVQRRQLVEEKYQEDLQRQKSKVEHNQNVLARRMLKEEKYERKQNEIDQRNREYERKFYDEQARSVIEGRNQEYLMRMTDTGTDMLDPAGRMSRIDPSTVVTIPDKAFGTGQSVRYSRDRLRNVTSKVRAKLRADEEDFGEYAHLLSSLQSKATTTEQVDISREAQHTNKAQHPVPAMEQMAKRETDDVPFDSTNPKYPPPIMSKFEEYMHENARERQRARLELGTQQIAAGKTFVGQAFVPKPNVIEFKDFEVGRTYKMRVQLTNTSYSFNSFKIHAICDDYLDFFEVTYTKPGRISAGVSCWLEVVFTPQLNEDIDTVLPCLAETGPFQIPIICSKRRCEPVVVTHRINFGEVVVGETAEAELVIENKGILPANCTFHHADVQQLSSHGQEHEVIAPNYRQFYRLPACHDEQELVDRVEEICTLELREREGRQSGVCRFDATAMLEGYSALRHRITCSPLQPGQSTATIIIDVSSTDSDMRPQQLQVQVSFTATKLPVFLPEEVLEFDCCGFGKMYRRKLVVANRAKVPHKIQLKVPTALARCIELLPDMGFVQPDRPFEVLVKFTPDELFLKEMACFSTQETSQMLIPLQIGVPEQSLPVFFQLRAQLTASSILITPKAVDFGNCYTNQQLSRTLEIQNPSLLPVQFGFHHQSKDFGVDAAHAIGMLLPAEIRSIPILFKPTSAIACKERLEVWTTMNDRTHVQLSGQGVDAPVEFSHNVLELRTTVPGERNVAAFVARNRTNSQQTVEFVIPRPELSWLTVSPKVLVLDAHASTRVEIAFQPPQEPAQFLQDKLEGEQIPVAEGEVEVNAPSAKNWSVHARWSISCFVKAKGSRSMAPLLPLECHTVCIPENIVMDIPQDYSNDEGCLNFGAVPVGKRKVVTVRMRNAGSQQAISTLSGPFNALGPFSVVNAIREVMPRSTFPLKLAFEPSRHGTCAEVLELSTQPYGQVIKLKVQGVGVSPSVTLDPESGILDFGSVLATDSKEISFNVRNTCPFVLQFHVQRLHDPAVTRTGIPVFCFQPERAVVQPGEAVEVKCTFQPDRERIWPFREDVQIQVANQAQELIVRCFGRCWDRQMYCIPSDAKYEVFNRVAESTEYLGPVASSQSWITPMKPLPIRIVFDDPFDGVASNLQEQGEEQEPLQPRTIIRSLTIGSAKISSPHLNGSTGQFEIQLSDPLKSLGVCTITPDKGTVQPGQEITVTATMTAPAPRIVGGLDVGQWETFDVACLLKGGFAHDGQPTEQSVVLEFVAFIRPQPS